MKKEYKDKHNIKIYEEIQKKKNKVKCEMKYSQASIKE